MKEFDIEKAKNGAKVCTRNGNPARIVCWDVKDELSPILALVTEKGIEVPYLYLKDGRMYVNETHFPKDLMME